MKRSEIWLINLDPSVGSEIKKTRPAIIVNVDQLGKLPLKVIVPLTDWKAHYSTVPWMVKISVSTQNGLSKTSSADCFQVRSVAQERFVKKLGYLKSEQMEEIVVGLSAVLKLN